MGLLIYVCSAICLAACGERITGRGDERLGAGVLGWFGENLAVEPHIIRTSVIVCQRQVSDRACCCCTVGICTEGKSKLSSGELVPVIGDGLENKLRE